ncbi:MAG: hypothetical protein Q8Q88_01330 [Phenylobacterium sp.]|uniref:DUF7379 domain-containing protein n=1 Tax=Phenylobacterium sp. TaxID=1871053 RepID=UPI0027332F95|nr:hypothetical protein [Phenylobacterium sp.]MDP3745667.1 hypothetical protein [Phenylobacterium sp.]
MAQVDLGGGVVVETAERIQVRRVAADAALAAAVEPERQALTGALALAGFEVAAEMDLRGKPGAGVGLAASAESPKIKADVAAGESAVVLLEGQGGVFAWGYPDRQPGVALSADGARTLTFTLARPRQDGALGFGLSDLRRGPIFNWLVDKMVDPVRAYVLKFAAGKIIDVAVKKIEGDMATGLIGMAGGPDTWIPGHAIPPLAKAKPAKILLMVHGTFSSTAGSFTQLAKSPDGQAFLAHARGAYDAVLSFDHKTLADTPEQNARAILDALIAHGVPPNSALDAVAYSRGGLVYRELAETLLAQERPDIKLGKAVFVGCTNGGTNLAEPENWEAMVDLYTNIILAGARAVAFASGAGVAVNPLVDFGIKTLGRFLQSFSEVAISDRRVPGLAAMEPDGALVGKLNGAAGGLDRLATYHAVTSNFVPRFEPKNGISKELAQALLDRITNRLFQGDNDLVVHTKAMTQFGTRQSRLANAAVLPVGSGEDIYHTVYFTSDEVARQLRAWLT